MRRLGGRFGDGGVGGAKLAAGKKKLNLRHDNGGRATRVASATPLGGNAPTVKEAPAGIEDMASGQTAGVVWAHSEFPGRRWVWSRPFSDLFG